MSNSLGSVVLNSSQIMEGVRLVAHQLNTKFSGEEIVVVTMVPGGMLFAADLVRELKMDVMMDYISCPHTPGDRNNTSAIVYHQNVNISNRHVLLVDDAIESGGTMKRVVEHLKNNYNTKSISIATLFVKPGRIPLPVEQYFAYEMENDDLLIGYGLPWKDKHRNLPYVAKLALSP